MTGLGVTGLAPDGEVEDHPAIMGVALPEIGVAKELDSAVRESYGIYQVTFQIRVDNLGNVPLTNVQVTENLATTFALATSFSVLSVTSPTLTVNPGFNGAGDTNLLAAGNTLAVGASGTITLTLRVVSSYLGPFTNQVTAQGDTPAGPPVTDVSQDGADSDPNADGDAGDNNVPTVFSLPINAIEIPTLGTWGLLALMVLLGAFAVRRMRRSEG